MKHILSAGVLSLGLAVFSHSQALAQQAPADGPRFSSANELARPTDLREWIFVTAGANPPPNFTNIYVNPSSYRSFMSTGRWPDKTMFVVEIRSSASEGSMNEGGNSQTGLVAMEASVKDEARYPGKWAYFNFGRGAEMKDRVEALSTTATCYACHAANGAVDNTFVQFYPTLLEVAREKGTVR